MLTLLGKRLFALLARGTRLSEFRLVLMQCLRQHFDALLQSKLALLIARRLRVKLVVLTSLRIQTPLRLLQPGAQLFGAQSKFMLLTQSLALLPLLSLLPAFHSLQCLTRRLKLLTGGTQRRLPLRKLLGKLL